MVFGGDVVRLLHGDECFTVSAPDSEDVNAIMSSPLNGVSPGSPPNTVPRLSAANVNANAAHADAPVG